MVVGNCSDCGKVFKEGTQIVHCNFRTCEVWSHSVCLLKDHTDYKGRWYCVSHLDELLSPVKSTALENSVRESILNSIENELQFVAIKERALLAAKKRYTTTENIQVENEINTQANDNENPFLNFNCEVCDTGFDDNIKGVACATCQTVFHTDCLNDYEQKGLEVGVFTCQHCLIDDIRRDSLKKRLEKQEELKKSQKLNTNKDKAGPTSASSPKVTVKERESNAGTANKTRSTKKVKKVVAKNEKTVSFKKNEKSSASKIVISSDSSSCSSENESDYEDNSDSESNTEFVDNKRKMSSTEALVGLYKLTQAERFKSKYEKLPLVEQLDNKWTVFFDLFSNTRYIFCDAENVIRIQNSIKAKEILDIGGSNLFDPLTYWQTLKMIDKRIRKSVNLLQRETNEIIQMKKFKYDTDNKKILEFINKVVNYSNTVKKYGKPKDVYDERVISHIANILPTAMMNAWHRKKAKLDDSDEAVSIDHIAKFLSKQVSYLNSKISATEIDPWKESHPQKQTKKPEQTNKRNFQHGKKDSAEHNDEVSSYKYCWFHKTDGHGAFSCTKLWSLSGKEVSELAKQNQICTFCGKSKHKDCRQTNKLKCRLEGCTFNHHMLFCFKREPRKFNDENKKQNNSTKRQNQSNKRQNHSNKRPNEKTNKQNQTKKNNKSENNAKANYHKENESESSDCDTSSNDDTEVEVPQSNYYMNRPPAKFNTGQATSCTNSILASRRTYPFTYQAINNHAKAPKIKFKHTSDCILGVIVIHFVESNTNAAFLLDSGSTVSMIEQEFADKCSMSGLWDPLRLTWSGNVSRLDAGSRIVKTQVRGTQKDSKVHDIYFRTMNKLGMGDQPFKVSEICENFPYLNSLRLSDYTKVTGVIGIDNMWCFDQLKVHKPKNWQSNMPYGIESPLGDYVVGDINQLKSIYEKCLRRHFKSRKNHKNFTHTVELTESEQAELLQMENEVLGLEYNQICPHDNEPFHNKLALDLLNKHVKRCENGVNFEVPLLWKEENIKLPTEKSYKTALRRYLIVEKSSMQNGNHEAFVTQIENLLSKDYAELVPRSEINIVTDRTFYIPTFFIQPKGKRLRFIWDAAANVDGKSLNDYLLAGPNLYANSKKITFNMRENKYIIKGDLQEMFHMVWIRKEDRDSLRFLFRRSPQEPFQVLRMKVMIFGSKSSPICSQFIKNKVAEEFAAKHPNACKIIKESTYVDDVIFSISDLEQAKLLIYEISKIFKSGGFNLVKLNSNNRAVFEFIESNRENLKIESDKLFSKESQEKLLGYVVNFDTDEIQIALTLEKIPNELLSLAVRPTKKQILQVCMSIYDPVGFFEFLLAKFKLLFHWTIKDSYEWTQTIDDKYLPTWKNSIEQLSEIKTVKIPRFYSPFLSTAKYVQLIGFGDAGTEILCNCVYIRLLNERREYLGHQFVCAKSYVVPIKQSRTIPDLELDVACKLAHLMKDVTQMHNFNVNEFIYFTDNIAVKEWIVNDAKNPKIYVKNRLDKIHKLTNKNEWRWIPTHLQPADYGTKVSANPTITYNNDWFNPQILSWPEENWPNEPNSTDYNVQKTFNMLNDTNYESIIEFNRFSSLKRVISVAQICLSWVYKAKNAKFSREIDRLKEKTARTRKQQQEINSEILSLQLKMFENSELVKQKDFKYAQIETALIKMAQKEAFMTDYDTILAKRPLAKSHSLSKLLPYADSDGIIRATTRIANTAENVEKFGSDRLNPIILPRLHKLTALIIHKFHIAAAHHNEKVVILNLLQQFYIPKIKSTVNHVIKRDCFKCRLSHARPEIPLMGDIPGSRLAFHMPAFSYVICDLLGPIVVKVTRNTTAKRYILVYSCLTTRALHLELIESLEAQATLRALQNTFNLRGVPKRIHSDNGTNFVGGQKILQTCHDSWNRELLDKGLILEPIEWCFSPPRAPHMNGAVERMVGMVKTALKHITQLMNKKLSHFDDYGLRTIMCEIINLLNSRPLEILPFEDGQNGFLTPNHFILGRQNAQSVPPTITEPRNLSQYWEDIKMITNVLWDKWLKGFLPNILIREKWIDYTRPLRVGDIVITLDPSIANSWRLGTVEKVILGSKNQVRQVMVRLGKNKTLQLSTKVSKTDLNKLYTEENFTLVSRPAIAVARVNLDN